MTGKSILFVEDDRDIRMLLADFLVREGFAVEVAEDGAAVDRVLARTRPDLVILDLMLPGEDGLSICRRLRARGAVPIIMLTAKNDDVDRTAPVKANQRLTLANPRPRRHWAAKVISATGKPGRGRGQLCISCADAQ
jgi:two-component system OmpR family response regulator